MKKLFIIITLFMSSFFFVNFKAKAIELSFDIDLSLINDEFFKVKEVAGNFIKEDTTFSDNYIITFENNFFYVGFFPLNFNVNSFYVYHDGSNLYFLTGSIGLKKYKFSSSDNTLISSGSFSSNYLKPYSGVLILYSNYDIKFRDDTSNVITYNYNNWSTQDLMVKEESFNTLYINYLEYQEYVGNPHHDKQLETVSNFYTVCIEKLSYLSTVIVDNYIYLSIIVIFLLIFVFKLIFRRYL